MIRVILSLVFVQFIVLVGISEAVEDKLEKASEFLNIRLSSTKMIELNGPLGVKAKFFNYKSHLGHPYKLFQACVRVQDEQDGTFFVTLSSDEGTDYGVVTRFKFSKKNTLNMECKTLEEKGRLKVEYLGNTKQSIIDVFGVQKKTSSVSSHYNNENYLSYEQSVNVPYEGTIKGVVSTRLTSINFKLDLHGNVQTYEVYNFTELERK